MSATKRNLTLVAAGVAMAAVWVVVVVPVACVGGAIISGADHESEAGMKGAPFALAALVIGIVVIPFWLSRLALRLDRRTQGRIEEKPNAP